MSIQVTTVVSENRLEVTSPYNPDVIDAFKARGGKWDGDKKCWAFESGSVKNGLLAVKELFGISEETVTIQVEKADDGREYMSNAEAIEKGVPPSRPDDGPLACGTVQVRPPKVGWQNGQYVSVGGYLLASRRGRDYGANLVETLVSGTVPKTGGSVKNPDVRLAEDCVFELEVRKDWAIDNGFMVGEANEDLRAEKAALLKRIAQIDAILEEDV